MHHRMTQPSRSAMASDKRKLPQHLFRPDARPGIDMYTPALIPNPFSHRGAAAAAAAKPRFRPGRNHFTILPQYMWLRPESNVARIRIGFSALLFWYVLVFVAFRLSCVWSRRAAILLATPPFAICLSASEESRDRFRDLLQAVSYFFRRRWHFCPPSVHPCPDRSPSPSPSSSSPSSSSSPRDDRRGCCSGVPIPTVLICTSGEHDLAHQLLSLLDRHMQFLKILLKRYVLLVWLLHPHKFHPIFVCDILCFLALLLLLLAVCIVDPGWLCAQVVRRYSPPARRRLECCARRWRATAPLYLALAAVAAVYLTSLHLLIWWMVKQTVLVAAREICWAVALWLYWGADMISDWARGLAGCISGVVILRP